jgi:hypothetical protein
MFPLPKRDPGMVSYFKELIESGEFRPRRRMHAAECPAGPEYLIS